MARRAVPYGDVRARHGHPSQYGGPGVYNQLPYPQSYMQGGHGAGGNTYGGMGAAASAGGMTGSWENSPGVSPVPSMAPYYPPSTPASPGVFGVPPMPYGYPPPQGYVGYGGVPYFNEHMGRQDFPEYRAAEAGPGDPIQTTTDLQGPDRCNLFIFHIPNNMTNQVLYELFSPHGNVISARIMVDRATGRSRGFGFVSFDNPASAQSAIESLNGHHIGHKRLKVQHKKERDRGHEGGGRGAAPAARFERHKHPHQAPAQQVAAAHAKEQQSPSDRPFLQAPGPAAAAVGPSGAQTLGIKKLSSGQLSAGQDSALDPSWKGKPNTAPIGTPGPAQHLGGATSQAQGGLDSRWVQDLGAELDDLGAGLERLSDSPLQTAEASPAEDGESHSPPQDGPPPGQQPT